MCTRALDREVVRAVKHGCFVPAAATAPLPRLFHPGRARHGAPTDLASGPSTPCTRNEAHIYLVTLTRMRQLVGVALVCCSAAAYDVTVSTFEGEPVLAHKFHDKPWNSDFQQVFNPSWVAGPRGEQGLLSRSQNCTPTQPGDCVSCQGTGEKASVLTFSRLISGDGTDDHPVFTHVGADSVVFGPHDATDDCGTEDPRIVFDVSSGLFWMYYTCFNSGKTSQEKITMCVASTADPTTSSGWTRHGPVGLPYDSKSGAVLLREATANDPEPEHLMYWGAGVIHLSRSRDLTQWPIGTPFLTNTSWGNPHVEAGPPPLRLSTGDWLFFHNSWSANFPEPPGYQPAWVILSGDDPTVIVQRASEPLWSPADADWMTGDAPSWCNVPNVAFVEAAHPVAEPDTFRVYFGGADAVVGTAVVKVTRS